MSEQNNQGWSDDIISLEDLVGSEPAGASSPAPPPPESVAGAPVPPPEAPSAESSPAPTPPPSEAAGVKAAHADGVFDLANLDKALEAEDPGFTASLSEVKEGAESGDVDIDSLDLSELIREESLKGRQKIVLILFKRPARRIKEGFRTLLSSLKQLPAWLVSFSKTGFKSALKGAKAGAAASVGYLKGLIAKFSALPTLSKLMILATVIAAAALVFVVRITFRGDFMPELKPDFLESFADVADHRYEYDPEEPLEEFNSPALQPESVVLLDKVVVNLKRSDEFSNPMGMFEIYVEAASREAAIELKDREIEARDTVARTLEQITYDAISTPEGKIKLKLIIRKDLNSLLTQGRVRKVYFKSMVVKP